MKPHHIGYHGKTQATAWHKHLSVKGSIHWDYTLAVQIKSASLHVALHSPPAHFQWLDVWSDLERNSIRRANLIRARDDHQRAVNHVHGQMAQVLFLVSYQACHSLVQACSIQYGCAVMWNTLTWKKSQHPFPRYYLPQCLVWPSVTMWGCLWTGVGV